MSPLCSAISSRIELLYLAHEIGCRAQLLGPRMTQFAREPYQRPSNNYSYRAADWLAKYPPFSHDPLLELAYAISEWAITFVGPIFWMCLVYLFWVAAFTDS